MAAVGTASVMVCAVGLSQAGAAQPSPQALTSAVKRYLSDHGDLCVGKFTWPRVVTPEDRRASTNDAVQLPVLERLGLVESTAIPAPPAATPMSLAPLATGATTENAAQGSQSGTAAAPAEAARRYSLTAAGRRFYLRKQRTVLGAHEQPVERQADFCVARVSLEKVVKWTPPQDAHGHLETVVSFTYKIKSADWMADPEARKVFPVVDRVIRGQGHLLMTANVQEQKGSWVPVLPGQ